MRLTKSPQRQGLTEYRVSLRGVHHAHFTASDLTRETPGGRKYLAQMLWRLRRSVRNQSALWAA